MPGASSTNHSGWIRVLWSNMASGLTRETLEKTLRFGMFCAKKNWETHGNPSCLPIKCIQMLGESLLFSTKCGALSDVLDEFSGHSEVIEMGFHEEKLALTLWPFHIWKKLMFNRCINHHGYHLFRWAMASIALLNNQRGRSKVEPCHGFWRMDLKGWMQGWGALRTVKFNVAIFGALLYNRYTVPKNMSQSWQNPDLFVESFGDRNPMFDPSSG